MSEPGLHVVPHFRQHSHHFRTGDPTRATLAQYLSPLEKLEHSRLSSLKMFETLQPTH